MSRNQAPFCLYTLRTISDRTEGTFERLRYLLGGDRPSQTVHQTVSQDQIHGLWLESKHYKRVGTYPTRNFATLGPL